MADNDLKQRRRWVRPTIVTTSIALVLALAAGVAFWQGSRRGTPEQDKQVRTAVVERTSLVASLQLTGFLDYGTPKDLGGGGGVVTKLPEAGMEYQAGDVLFEADGAPVFILHGELPLWRVLSAGTSGPDVNALRAALTEAGFDAGQDSPVYDAPLAGAVDQLYAKYQAAPPSQRDEPRQARETAEQALTQAQADLREAEKGPDKAILEQARVDLGKAQREYDKAWAGEEDAMPLADAEDLVKVAQATLDDLQAPVDTTTQRTAVAAAQKAVDDAALSPVGPGDILMVPTKTMRVDQVKADLGSPAEGAVLSWTDTTVFARVDLTEAQRQVFVAGTPVNVTLPGGQEIVGVIGDVSESRWDDMMGMAVPAQARIDFEDQAALTETSLGSVTIVLVQDEAEQALVVPVTALLALAEGGYAVQLTDGTLIGVELGLQADTRIQVTPTNAGELQEGDEVIVA